MKRATPVQVQTVPVGLGDTIGQVLDLAAEKHCWGVYIVDEYNHPSGVISLGELLKVFV